MSNKPLIPYQVRHEMILQGGGDEWVEWYCPVCQRRVRYYTHPYKRVVVDYGDQDANHCGSNVIEVGAVGYE